MNPQTNEEWNALFRQRCIDVQKKNPYMSVEKIRFIVSHDMPERPKTKESLWK